MTHCAQLLALLRSRGKQGVFNYEACQITPRHSARADDLRAGRHDGIKHNISYTRISKSVYKLRLHDNDLPAEEVLEILTNAPETPKVSKEEAMAKWREAGRLLKGETNNPNEAYIKKVNEFREKLQTAESWIRQHQDRMTPRAAELALSKRDFFENQLNHYQQILKGGE